MPRNARQDRGRETELIAARYYRETIWPQCQAVSASAPGRDLINTPGAAGEVKARSKFSPVQWARQAQRNAGDDMPFVLMRPIGFGKETIADWLVFMPNRYFVDLWRKAHGGSGSRRAHRRTARQKSKQDPGKCFRVRVESPSSDDGSEVLERAVSPLLHDLGFEPGDYEMEIRRLPSSPSETRV